MSASAERQRTDKPAASAWYDVFVCYSRRDREFVERISAALTDGGKNVYVDWRIPDWSPDYQSELLGAIDASNTFVFVLSPDSLRSPHCKLELDRAIQQGKRIRPLLRRDVEDAAVADGLRGPQWLDFRRENAFDDEAARLLQAVDVDPEWVHDHTRIGVRAVEWDRNGRDRSFLLRGSDLRDAEQWLAEQTGKEPAPTELHVQYVLASRRAAVRQQRVVLVAVVAALAVALVLALLALLQRNRAIEQRDNAASRGVATQALAELDGGDFDRGVLLSLEALRTKPTFEARSAAVTAMERTDRVEALLRSPTRGQFADIAISPDGRLVAAGGSDRAVHVWDLRTRRPYGKPLRLPSPDEPVRLTFGPKGDQIAVNYNGSNTTIWSLSAQAARAIPLRDEPNRDGYVWSAAFSPDGSTVATGGFQGEIDLWDARTGAHRRRLRGTAAKRPGGAPEVAFVGNAGLADYVDGVLTIWNWRTARRTRGHRLQGAPLFQAFSPGGERLVTLNLGRYTVWDVRSQRQVGWVHPDVDRSVAVALSPDGQTIAFLGSGGEITLWDVRPEGGSRRDLPLLGDTQAVTIAFDREGSRIVTGGTGLLTVWQLNPAHRLVDVLAGDPLHDIFLLDQNEAATVAFGHTSHGDRLVWATADGITAWSPEKGIIANRQLAGRPSFYNYAVSPDGTGVAVAELERIGVLRFDRSPPRPTFSAAASPEALAYSSDGRMLASGGNDGWLTIWDARTGARLGSPVRASSEIVWDVAIDPAGTMLVGVGYGDFVSRWTIAREGGRVRLVPARPHLLHGHSGAVSSVAFSPDSRLLATGDNQGVIRLWDARTGAGFGEALSAAGRSIGDLAFRPDSKILASGDDSGAIRLWDVAEGRELGRPLRAHVGGVASLSFRADGEQLASADINNAVLVWDSVLWSTDWSRLAGRLCAAVSRSLTRAEWEQFLPERPYRETCEGTSAASG